MLSGIPMLLCLRKIPPGFHTAPEKKTAGDERSALKEFTFTDSARPVTEIFHNSEKKHKKTDR